MSNHNQLHTSPERETFAHQEVVQFNDGEMALRFHTPGDKLPLGYESRHKYATHFGGEDMAIIKTKSGNVYSLAGSLIINKNRQQAFKLPGGTIQVTIGEPCVMPGVGSTSNVESVMLRYKGAAPDSEIADQQVDAPSPFKALKAQVEEIKNLRGQAK
jgi:hypothetical protein